MPTDNPHSAPRRASPPRAFTPAAIMARAHAHAAEQARRAAAQPVTPPAPGAPTGPEILAAIAAEIAQAEPAPRPAPIGESITVTDLSPAELLDSIAREIDGCRP